MSTHPSPLHDPAQARKLLNAVLVVALLDALLLLVLLYVAFVDRSDSAVSVIGPIHGVGFIAQLALAALGASRGLWGWWFPAVSIFAPIGALVGDFKLRRELPARPKP